MTLSSSEKSKKYRQGKIQTIADAQGLSFDDAKKVFNKLESDKRRARRMRQKNEAKQSEVKLSKIVVIRIIRLFLLLPRLLS
jgi:hypothetical protein